MKQRALVLLVLLIAGVLFCTSLLAAAEPNGTPAKAPAAPVEEVPLPTALPPYLQNPTADGMTICFLAQKAEQVRVAWGRDGLEHPLAEAAAAGVALEGTPWTIWKARLSGLSPKAVYQYQVLYRLPSGSVSTPLYHFRTPDPAAKALHLALFNDLHNKDETLEALVRHVKPDDFEFSFLLGDCWGDPQADQEAYEVFRTLNAYIPLLDASNKPFVFVRGNHETRGSFARQMAHLFDLPNLDPAKDPADQQWQFTLRAGPIGFLAMDAGEDDDFDTPQDSYKRPKFWQAYRQREMLWLKDLVDRRAGTDAPWRVFLSHIPLYSDDGFFSEPSRQYWEPVLLKADIDLMVAGHTHRWKLLPRGKRYTITYSKKSRKPPRTMTPPWPILIGGGPALNEGTVILLSANEKALRARVLAAQDGRILTEFVAEKNGAK